MWNLAICTLSRPSSPGSSFLVTTMDVQAEFHYCVGSLVFHPKFIGQSFFFHDCDGISSWGWFEKALYSGILSQAPKTLYSKRVKQGAKREEQGLDDRVGLDVWRKTFQ
ncbi:hypothetical protein Salat_2995200 [Sesamum alatum]|uniref:Uncharacterized protein n=1 Tax=Sesamum alatum TaxID=300844 RepID=A0AAE1XHH0_9LAMI|nr:hypothetical protein Salat_2995200 [Sesamum alatum]